MKLNTVLFCLCLLGLTACVKKEYQGPPDISAYDPNLTITGTIAQLIALPQETAIADDIVIGGIVVMDDKNGNYFKKIVLEDSTAGIEVLLDQSNLYNDFPVGRKLYIKCKGLYVGSYNGNPQLGYKPDRTGSVSEIPSLLINDFIVKANYPHPIVPDTVTITQLMALNAGKYLNRLIVIKDIEFTDSCIGVPYAETASISSSTSLSVQDCKGKSISLRTNASARFQPYLTPQGNGMLAGIFTKYYNNPQIVIRDTSDVQFRNIRCDGSGNGGWKELFYQDFSGVGNNAEITLDNWINFDEAGGKKYTKGIFQSDIYAKISAYGGAVPDVVKTWLITPAINLSGKSNVKLIFKTKDGFDNGATLKAYLSVDYSGVGDPNVAAWTDLGAMVSSGHESSYATEWTVANVPLNYTMPVRIAFKYEGGGNKTTTFELGYIKVTAE